jgi:curved DNA-binding protein CbpA
MARRFHPDNPESGDAAKFVLLNRAYEVLSDPQRRADYDAARRPDLPRANPIFESGVFVNGIEGEANRRLGVLSLLYQQRRTNPREARVSLLDLEKKMGFPRDYLDFTTWYLKSKGYIEIEDNSDFSLTASGVDYVEARAQSNPILHRLLTAGSGLTGEAQPSPSDNEYSLQPLLQEETQ